jgi:2-phosphoglycerate kinase
LNNQQPVVFLIGGTPGAGKSTLANALASRLGLLSLSIDDLVTAAVAITTPESHPGLHSMRHKPYAEYFTNSTVERLKEDATARHEATWPMVAAVIKKHARWGPSIVIDGWHMRPQWVAELNLDNVRSAWIVAAPDVLREREQQNTDFWQVSPEPERMYHNFLGRSLWYNTLIEEQAQQYKMTILYQGGTKSVEDFCQIVQN